MGDRGSEADGNPSAAWLGKEDEKKSHRGDEELTEQHEDMRLKSKAEGNKKKLEGSRKVTDVTVQVSRFYPAVLIALGQTAS